MKAAPAPTCLANFHHYCFTVLHLKKVWVMLMVCEHCGDTYREEIGE